MKIEKSFLLFLVLMLGTVAPAQAWGLPQWIRGLFGRSAALPSSVDMPAPVRRAASPADGEMPQNLPQHRASISSMGWWARLKFNLGLIEMEHLHQSEENAVVPLVRRIDEVENNFLFGIGQFDRRVEQVDTKAVEANRQIEKVRELITERFGDSEEGHKKLDQKINEVIRLYQEKKACHYDELKSVATKFEQEMKRELDLQRMDIEALHAQVEEVERTAQRSCEGLHTKMSKQSMQIQSARKQAAGHDEQVRRLDSLAHNNREGIAQLKRQLVGLSSRMSEVETQRERRNVSVKKLRQKVGIMLKKHQEIEKLVDEMSAEEVE